MSSPICFPRPIRLWEAATIFLATPSATKPRTSSTFAIDHSISDKDNFFARFSYGNDSNFLPSPFNNILDGGSFQDGYSNNTAQGLAASEIAYVSQQSDQRISLRIQSPQFPPLQPELQRQRRAATQLSRSSLSAPNHRRTAFNQLRRWHHGHWQLRNICPPSNTSTAMFLRQSELGSGTPRREVWH